MGVFYNLNHFYEDSLERWALLEGQPVAATVVAVRPMPLSGAWGHPNIFDLLSQDEARPGQVVSVRYLPGRPDVVRLERNLSRSQPPLAAWQALLGLTLVNLFCIWLGCKVGRRRRRFHSGPPAAFG